MEEVGSLRGTLTLDDREWGRALSDARSSMASFVQEVRGQLAQMEQAVRRVGIGLTAGVTLPFAGLVTTSVRGAANFETAMNKVNASMRSLNPQQLAEMGRMARELGPQVGMGATEAASAIETLALAGMDASTIMAGGLRSALTLAAANMGDVAASGAMVQNVLQQFQLTAADLPMVVNRITGALDNSQFGFEDFRLGIAQAGTVASAAGVSFEDFTTALAATSSAFASGSDAGTSFKTYLNTLTPNSKEATRAMELLGISFFTTTGRIKPLAEQAEMLRTATANLADQARQNVFEEIFGADAARTAIALARTGRDEFQRMGAAIGDTDASEKLAIQMRGLSGAIGRLKASFEELKIAIGETGLLDLMTRIVEGLSSFVRGIAEANPAILKFGVIVAGIGAVLGPMVLLLIPLAKFILWRIAAGFGLIGKAIQLLLFPIATLVEWFGALAARFALGALFTALTGPIGIAIAAFVLFGKEIIQALSAAWESAKQVLGPPLHSLFTNVGRVFSAIGNLFSQVANGPIGEAISAIIGFLGELRDVIGAVIGNLLYNALSLVINLIAAVVQAISDMVSVIASLLSGDWAGAWDAAVSAVSNFGQNIVNALSTAFPALSGLFQGIYDLLSGFVQFIAWVVGKVAEFVGGVIGFFVNLISPITDAVRSVYNAVSEWLYDKFGWVYDGVKSIAEGIVNLWNWVKGQLGIGGGAGRALGEMIGGQMGAIGAAQAAIGVAGGIRIPGRPGTQNPSLAAPARQRRGGGGGGGRNRAEELAERREELRLQQLLALAREEENRDEIRRIEQIIERNRLIKQYKDLGLDAAQAIIAADRDLLALRAAEEVARTRNLGIQENEVDLQVAQLNNDHRLIDQLEKQADLRQLIARYANVAKDAAEAEALARAALNQIEDARTRRRERDNAANERNRQIRMAEDRGDTDRARQLRREDEIRSRTEDIANRLRLDPEDPDARAQAEQEWSEAEEARQVGNWRSVFRDGLRAAMDGDMLGWLKERWTDIWTRALEDSFNKVADLLRDLLKSVMSNMSGGGSEKGGIFGSLLNGLGSIFGGSLGAKPDSGLAAIVTGMKPPSGLPGFARGGALQLGGLGGVDRNLLSLNGNPIARVTRGETMEVKPANDRGREVNVRAIKGDLFDIVIEETAAKVAAPMARKAAVDGRAGAIGYFGRRAVRSLPAG